MEQSQLPLYLARSICFDLIHLVNEHCRGQKNAASNSPIELSGMETAQEIIQMLRAWSEHLSGLTASAAKRVVLDEVMKYLEANCLRCDFSAYEAAGHFEMTLPAFSKYFKEQTGQNVMDYTIHLRMERAKELLRTTALPLKEISEAVGYYNISSFTRRFKLNQGITPSEYRKVFVKDRPERPPC
jgi:two-component system response regulator YesN